MFAVALLVVDHAKLTAAATQVDISFTFFLWFDSYICAERRGLSS